MKLKGISTLEQHVEKYVLAGAAAALAGVVVWQLMDVTKVKVGPAEVSHSEIFDGLKTSAMQTKNRVEDLVPKLPEAPNVNLAEAFQSALKAKVVPKDQLISLGLPVTLDRGQGDVAVDSMFEVITAPAPTDIRAHGFWSTIDPLEPASTPEIATVLPAAQPFDKPAVSVQITFDGTEFKRILDQDSDGPDGPIQPVRRAWYRELEIIGIELQREELLPDGTFGKAATVPPMPGRFNGEQTFNTKVKAAGDVPTAIADVKAAAGEAVRPAFYDTLEGTPSWIEPALVTETGEDLAEKNLKSLFDKRASLQKQLDSINKKLQDRGATRVTSRDGGGGGGGKSGGAAAPPTNTDTKKDATTSTLERNATNVSDELDKNRRAIEALGFNAATGEELPKTAAVTKAEAPLLDNKAFKAWAHDVFAEPGKVYRYRARVLYNNPYFGQAGYLKDEQKKLAENAIGRGNWSTWTGDVPVDAQENFFITSASPTTTLGGPRATVEMYKFYYGYPRRASVNLQPGDVLAGTARLPEGLLVFDIKKLADERAKPEGANPPPSDRDGGGGKGSGIAAPPAADPEKPKEEVPGIPVPRELAVSVNAMLLDAAFAVGGNSAERSLAYLRMGSDQIATRFPDQERLSSLYKRLSSQARVGDSQGKSKPTLIKKEKKTVDPVPLPPPRSDPGGGGGGGGGGG